MDLILIKNTASIYKNKNWVDNVKSATAELTVKNKYGYFAFQPKN